MTIGEANTLLETLGEWVEWWDEQMITEMSLEKQVEVLQKQTHSLLMLNAQLCLLMAEKFDENHELNNLIIVPGRDNDRI